MSHTISRILGVSAVATAAVVLTAGPSSAAASAAACPDAVSGALHTAHTVTGDPAGVIHGVEETYCSAG